MKNLKRYVLLVLVLCIASGARLSAMAPKKELTQQERENLGSELYWELSDHPNLSLERVRELIQKGADVNIVGFEGKTLLLTAVWAVFWSSKIGHFFKEKRNSVVSQTLPGSYTRA